MKILIFSDNHRNKENVQAIINQNPGVDRIISLGDSEMTEAELNALNIIGVKGNFPFEPKFPLELNFNFEGINILFTHGHLYHVKLGLTRLINNAKYRDFDMVCFGHTHRSYLEEIDELIVFNPGSLSNHRSFETATYGLIEIDSLKVKINIFDLKNNKIKSLVKKR